MMSIDQVGAWLKSKVPDKEQRRLLIMYALQLGAVEGMRQQIRKSGVDDGTLRMVEMGGASMLDALLSMGDK